MKTCPYCNNQCADTETVCANCGYSLEATASDCSQEQCTVKPESQTNYTQNYQQSVQRAPKDKLTAGLLGIFLGSLGIHKFYLGYNSTGVIMLLITILGTLVTFGAAAVVMQVIGIVEGILYLTKDDVEFQETYVFNEKKWF